MRPLLKTGSPKEVQTQPAYGLLINAFGPYCAISEEPLYDVAYVWDKAANAEFPANQPPSENWSNLLLLSPGICEAWRLHHPQPSSELLLPDADTTFRLYNSPFVYSLETINVIYTDDMGRKLIESGTEELVTIRGTTAKARATIETFSLNTEYFDPERKELRIPWGEYLSRQDVIIRSRTVAWRRATAAADQIEAVRPEQRSSLFRQLQISAVATGHWSVWATVLWDRLHDRDLVSSVLGNRAGLHGFGPHNEFPGTASTWLPRTASTTSIGALRPIQPTTLRFEIKSLDPTRRTLDFVPEVEALARELQTLVAAQYAGVTIGIQRAAGIPVDPAVQELIVSAHWRPVGRGAATAFAKTVTAELLKLFKARLRNLFTKPLQTETHPKGKPAREKKSRSSRSKRKR
jgi:hypothetical protein